VSPLFLDSFVYSLHFKDRSAIKESEKEKLKEREREWNKRPITPNRSPAHVHERVHKLSAPGSGTARDSPHSLTIGNLELHHRRSSSRNSLRLYSPASSIASFDQDRDRESEHARERNWNSPHPKWDGARGSPSPTPSVVSERRRTLSHPTRPSLGSRPRYDSMTSSSSSRAASPALSHSSKASVEEVIEYERERNWNSSRPSWSASTSVANPDSTSRSNEDGAARHRCSFTEFHQVNGAIPPRVSIQTLSPPRNLAPEDVLCSTQPLLILLHKRY
jgi:hypothetical protein